MGNKQKHSFGAQGADWLFTVIFEFRGGTYIKQVRANNPSAALLAWLRSLMPGEIPHLGAKGIEKMIREVESNDAGNHTPVPLSGLLNAWCAGTGCRSGLVNLIQTDVSQWM